MRSITVGAIAVMAIFVASAQAGQVYINDSQTTGITVTDNCGGTCFGNFVAVDNEHVTFDWYVGLGSRATSTDMSILWDGTTVSDYLIFSSVFQSSTVGVSFYSDGGSHDVNAEAINWYNQLGNPHLLVLDLETEGVSQKVADYLNFNAESPYPSIDQMYVTSGTPEPGTWVLIGTGLAGMVVARRRRRIA